MVDDKLKKKAHDAMELMLTNLLLRLSAVDWNVSEVRELAAAIHFLNAVASGPERVGVAEAKEMTLDEAIEQYLRECGASVVIVPTRTTP